MSTSLSSRSSGRPTRQQLDELDALLQRMLALPVNHAGDDVLAEINAAPKAAPSSRKEPVSYHTPDYGDDERLAVEEEEDLSAPTLAPRLDTAHVENNEDADNWVPLSSTWKPSPHTWKPLAQSWQQPRETATAQETPARHEEPDAAVKPVDVEPSRSDALESVLSAVPARTETGPQAPIVEPIPARASEAVPPLAGWQHPLAWFNSAFDLLLLPWGMPGRWLRRDGGGRAWLGFIGILLLLFAVGLGVMEWFDWTWEDVLAKIP